MTGWEEETPENEGSLGQTMMERTERETEWETEWPRDHGNRRDSVNSSSVTNDTKQGSTTGHSWPQQVVEHWTVGPGITVWLPLPTTVSGQTWTISCTPVCLCFQRDVTNHGCLLPVSGRGSKQSLTDTSLLNIFISRPTPQPGQCHSYTVDTFSMILNT